jgi:hypothetical protein
MCRNIKTLYNFAPAATEDEIRASSLQFVRKLSGIHSPSKANEHAFHRAVDEITSLAQELLSSLVTTATPRNRETEAAKAPARSAARFHNNRTGVTAIAPLKQTSTSAPGVRSRRR